MPRLYAETAARRRRQIAVDVVAVVILVLLARIGTAVHDLLQRLRGPGRGLQDSGRSFADSLAAAGRAVGRVPGVGGSLRSPLDAAAGAGRTLQQAGADQQVAVDRLSLALALLIAGLPALYVLLRWLPGRLREVRTMTAGARLRAAGAGAMDLFALRALAARPVAELAGLQRRLALDLADGWRRGDPAVVHGLAGLELQALGLREAAGRD